MDTDADGRWTPDLQDPDGVLGRAVCWLLTGALVALFTVAILVAALQGPS